MEYRKMDLELSGYSNEGGEEKFKVRVVWSPAVQQPADEAETVTIPKDLRTRLALLESRDLDLAEIIEVGTMLGDLLFPKTMKSYVNDNLKEIGMDVGLRIQLRISSYALADLPWEYACLPDPNLPPEAGFLAVDRRISMVRYEVKVKAKPTVSLNPIEKGSLPRLVTLMADPKTPLYPSLNLTLEREKIEGALKDLSKQLSAEFFPDVTLDVLMDALTSKTHVFHFAGHGVFERDMGDAYNTVSGKGYLVIFDDDMKPMTFPVENLLVALRGTGVRVVVLGACETGRRGGESVWTGIAPALAMAEIPAVVSMQYKILDKNAIRFSRAFYRSLAAHRSVDAAVTEGRMAIFLRRFADPKERDWGVPILYLRAEESEGVIFPELPPDAWK